MALQLKIASHSEIGLVRKNNQDSGYASPHLLVVADGMGGAAAGDLASAVAVDTIRRIDGHVDGEEMLEVLAGGIHRANDRIADLVEADPSLDGMGTTVTGALFDGAELGLAHIGDSRAYLLRGGHLERLTHDHSWVQSLVDEGKISSDEAAVHPHRSLLLKVLNGQPANDPDLNLVPLEVGDRLLFCSDGLCGLVDDPVIEHHLAAPELDEALDRLVEEARTEGGIDNITVIVADVVDDEGTSAAVILGAAAERPIPADARALPDELEDTLTVLPPAPGVGGAVEDEARYNPVPPVRRRALRTVLVLTVVLLLAAAALSAGYAWTRTQYYVGAQGEKVAIYKGLSEGLPGVNLASVYEVQNLTVAALPPYYQDKVHDGIDVSSLAAARQTVAELTEAARRCSTQPTTKPTPSATGASSATSSTTASGKPGGKPTVSPKPSVTPKPTPSPVPTSQPTGPSC